MMIKHYILTAFRLIVGKWWLSLIKLFSLTSGIISFLLIWFFYLDRSTAGAEGRIMMQTCSVEIILLIAFILLITTLMYFLVMKSQISIRKKELFWRRFYGETSNGIVRMIMIETTIFILIAFFLSLVLVDQVAPLFNMITAKDISLRDSLSLFELVLMILFLSILGFTVGILPSLWYARNRVAAMLKKISINNYF